MTLEDLSNEVTGTNFEVELKLFDKFLRIDIREEDKEEYFLTVQDEDFELCIKTAINYIENYKYET